MTTPQNSHARTISRSRRPSVALLGKWLPVAAILVPSVATGLAPILKNLTVKMRPGEVYEKICKAEEEIISIKYCISSIRQCVRGLRESDSLQNVDERLFEEFFLAALNSVYPNVDKLEQGENNSAPSDDIHKKANLEEQFNNREDGVTKVINEERDICNDGPNSVEEVEHNVEEDSDVSILVFEENNIVDDVSNHDISIDALEAVELLLGKIHVSRKSVDRVEPMTRKERLTERNFFSVDNALDEEYRLEGRNKGDSWIEQESKTYLLGAVYNEEADDGIMSTEYPLICEYQCKAVSIDSPGEHMDKNLGEILQSRMSNMNFADKSIISYLFDENLEESEILVWTGSVAVRRSHIRTLASNQLIDSRVVNAIVDLLKRYKQKQSPENIKYLWIPTTVTRLDRFRIDLQTEWSEWRDWIYIPIIFRRHWIVAVVNIQAETVYVLDNLHIPSVATGFAIVDEIVSEIIC
ncbi:Ulp1 protease family, C-terminal catalytic domain containing protein [Parasponia andersonii]|uniref:Ulp1 protease family, C-terminal catalytic domain containing protein n=1 Tax=Parasponia andersonii TaxID=3476 RepID=A0A2P5D3I1_PARAD|nr:Ulp1 protease family, C-terminal catalytic domain containing protein [Parasponia andersonii]